MDRRRHAGRALRPCERASSFESLRFGGHAAPADRPPRPARAGAGRRRPGARRRRPDRPRRARHDPGRADRRPARAVGGAGQPDGQAPAHGPRHPRRPAAQPLRRARARHEGHRSAPACPPTGCSPTAGPARGWSRSRPGRRGLHALPRQHRLGLRDLLRPGPPHDLRLRPRGLPLHAPTGRRTTRAWPSAASADARDPVPGLDADDEIAFMPPTRAPACRRPRPGRRASRPCARSCSTDPHRAASSSATCTWPARRPAGRGRRSTPPTATSATSATPTPTCSRSPSPPTTTTATRQGRRTATRRGTSCATPTARRRSRAGARATARRSPPARYRFRYDGRWLMTADRDLARRRAQLRPRPRRPLEGARVRAGPRLRDAVLRLRGGGHQLGRLVDAARRAGRAGPRDPRDVGRGLGDERHPPRDLLPRGDAPEDVAARPRRSRRWTASTRSGTSTPGASPASTTRALRRAWPSTGATTRRSGNLDDPCNSTTTPTRRRRRTRATGRCTRQLQRLRAPLPPVDRPARPDVLRRQRRHGLGGHRRPARLDRRPHHALHRGPAPGGAAQSAVAVPYYRDDACFDDGTGTRPRSQGGLRSGDEPRTASDGTPRASAGRRPTGSRTAATASSRARSPRTACTCCSSRTPTTRA